MSFGANKRRNGTGSALTLWREQRNCLRRSAGIAEVCGRLEDRAVDAGAGGTDSNNSASEINHQQAPTSRFTIGRQSLLGHVTADHEPAVRGVRRSGQRCLGSLND